MNKINNVSYQELSKYIKKIFMKVGLKEEDSIAVSDHHVLASLRGVDSHGVTRVKNYTDRLINNIVSKCLRRC